MEATSSGNRRGRRSREEILDAASHLMAQRGYAAMSIATLSESAGVSKSAIYHHFGSKAALLSAVTARGAHAFYDGMAAAHADPPRSGSRRERLTWYLDRTADVFAANPQFLRLHLLLVLSSETVDPEVADTIGQIRDEGRAYMNRMIRAAFDDAGAEAAQRLADRLEYFAIAGFDGAFIAAQADPRRDVRAQMSDLATAICEIGDAALAG